MFRDSGGQGFLELIYLYVHASKCCFIGVPFYFLNVLTTDFMQQIHH